ncbi:MAG: PDZ domain-containing protein, partial [Syntrophothermus sp.]
DVTFSVDTMSVQPDYVKVARKESGSMKFKVYVGTIPDYTAQVDGFKISGVSEGSPAQKAGLKAGDIIVQFGTKKVSNVYDYMYAMGEYAPGDTVDITVTRGTEKITFKVGLTAK